MLRQQKLRANQEEVTAAAGLYNVGHLGASACNEEWPTAFIRVAPLSLGSNRRDSIHDFALKAVVGATVVGGHVGRTRRRPPSVELLCSFEEVFDFQNVSATRIELGFKLFLRRNKWQFVGLVFDDFRAIDRSFPSQIF